VELDGFAAATLRTRWLKECPANMEHRKYFRHRIADLEALYSKATGNNDLLEELEQELVERDTKRAKRLLDSVRKSLEKSSGSPRANIRAPLPQAPPLPPRAELQAATISKALDSLPVEDSEAIDWRVVLSGVLERATGLPRTSIF